jgi:general stress protein 26
MRLSQPPGSTPPKAALRAFDAGRYSWSRVLFSLRPPRLRALALTCIKGRKPTFRQSSAMDRDAGTGMDKTLREKILGLLEQHRIMTLATNRPDGWPQATTVGYVNVGLTLYFLCSPLSQKAKNLTRDKRVSLTIDRDVSDPLAITGLSMAAEAEVEKSPAEISKVLSLLSARYPEYGAFRALDLDEILVFRVVPKVISVLDYTKGFGHTDLVTI